MTLTFRKIVKTACYVFDITPSSLKCPDGTPGSRDRDMSQIRGAIACIAIENGCKQADIARAFKRTHGAVHKARKEARNKYNPSAFRKAQRLRNNL